MEPAKKKRKWKRWMLIAAGIFAVGVLLLALQPAWLWRLIERSFPGVVWRVPTGEPVIALTFDDGPNPVYTPQVLDLLKKHNAHATFFLIGAHVRRYPELVARIRAEGHEIGNHTDSRWSTRFMSTAHFEQSLLRAEQSLDFGGRRKFLRPAGGLIWPAQLAVAHKHGYTVMLGSAYAFDGYRPPAAYIRWAITKNLEPGAVVILHDFSPNTVEAVEGILSAADKKGLRSVTLSELFAASTSARLP